LDGAINKASRAARERGEIHTPDELSGDPRGYFVVKIESEKTLPNRVKLLD
jgi:hypothetical protein